jgi:hypothetical protein
VSETLGDAFSQEIEEKDMLYLTPVDNSKAEARARRTSHMSMIQNNATKMKIEQDREKRMSARRTLGTELSSQAAMMMGGGLSRTFAEDDEKGAEDESSPRTVSPRIEEGDGEDEEAEDAFEIKEDADEPGTKGGAKEQNFDDDDILQSMMDTGKKKARSSPRASKTAHESPRSDDVDYTKLLGEQYRSTSCNMGGIYATRNHLLRSCGRWSSGLLDTERGIQDAYKHFIDSAQHYIYIENQFFVSGMEAETRGNNDSRAVKNTLILSLFTRIMKAALSKSTFRVYILIPLLPAMEGPVKGGALSSIAGVM